MFFEIWSIFTRQFVVYLRDFDGTVTKTVAKPTPFGLVAKRFWPFNIRNVLLLPDGKIYGDGPTEEWRKK